MNLQRAIPKLTAGSDTPPGTTLEGSWLLLARAGWAVVATLILVLFVVGIPEVFADLQAPCLGPDCLRLQLSPAYAQQLENLGLSLGFYAAYQIVLEAGLLLSFCAVAALLFWRKSNERMALFGAVMLVAFGGATFNDTILLLGTHTPVLWWPVTFVRCLGSASLFVFFYLFPDGRFVPRWTRWVAVVWVGFNLVGYFAPPTPSLDANAQNSTLFPIMALGFFVSVIVAQAHRYRHSSSPVERQQTKWVVFGFAAALTGLLALILFIPEPRPESGPNAVVYLLGAIFFFCAFLLLIPLSIGAAILRYRLFDIDLVINRTLVYGALTACVVGLYVLVVGYLGALFRTENNLLISLAVTGLVAVLFAPLKDRLQRAVNRLMYGERDEPYEVLSRLGRRLEASLAPEAVLPAVVEDIARALRLPHVAIWLADGETLRLDAAHGGAPARTIVWDMGAVENLSRAPEGLHPSRLAPSGEYGAVLDECGVVLVLPLTHRGELVGALCMAPRSPGETFSPADRQLLRDLATQAGTAAHAVQLTVELRSSLEDLRRSRERLVAAQEEERRRIQRDLHDGLGPVLASMRLRLEACLDMAEESEAPLSDGLQRLYDLVGQATADIRRLVYDLRPPVLDQLGLLPAIRQHCERCERESDIKVDFEAKPDLSIPAAAEVALLRVVQEALLNVQKHARASRVKVRLGHREGWIELEIRDDGVGFEVNGRGSGTGIVSMRERAEVLGGTLHFCGRPGGGAEVVVRIPTEISGEEVSR